MCEVTLDNLNDVYPDIEKAISSCKFITIDCEFSALNPSKKNQNSLFDTPSLRYEKLKSLCEQIIPVQIGISAFAFNPDKNSFLAETYTFYTFPRFFFDINPTFVCQSTSLQFLCSYNFDFNKFAYNGVSFINRLQEKEVLDRLEDESYGHIYNGNEHELENFIDTSSSQAIKFLHSSKEGDSLCLSGTYKKYKTSLDIRYIFHKLLREKFNKQLWTFEENGEIMIKKVSTVEFDELEKRCKLDKEFLDNMLGFTRVFRLMVESKKPIIGHNLITDLLLMHHHFEEPLPKNYHAFKKNIHKLFPAIFDTKMISFDIQKSIPDSKLWEHNTLSHLYQYFKDGSGRHLALNSPLIELRNPPKEDKFHNAGWDSYTTGYIFIRMAHKLAFDNYDNKNGDKIFMSPELFAAVEPMKNSLNLIRCSVSYINVAGDDPLSRRPPCLIVESAKRRPVDIIKVAGLLSPLGFVEVRPYGRRSAIVAVDNYGSVRRIMKQYRIHDDFNIKTYNAIRHSPVVRAFMWSGVVASGAMILWLASSLKNS